MIRTEIIRKIQESVFVPVPITEEANLYTDLGLDSLAFITLLNDIEDTYSIAFDITELEECLKVDRLITLVESKIKECES